MSKICIDAGHQQSVADTGATWGSVRESAINYAVAHALGALLISAGHSVIYTRDRPDEILGKTETESIQHRVAIANNSGCDYCISIHCNSYSDPAANGTETLICATGGKAEQLARCVQSAIVKSLGTTDRGVKVRTDLGILRSTTMTAILVELAFGSNPDDQYKLLDRQSDFAHVIYTGIGMHIGGIKVATPPVQDGTPIVARPTATPDQAIEWARIKGATPQFEANAINYWSYCTAIGINPVVAYAQYAKETGYGKFGGVIDASYCNPCGLKTTQGGSDTDPAAHQRFAHWEIGIDAHIDHLALYAGAPGYPRKDTPDPRHFDYRCGVAPTVEQLGGKWAPSPTYGQEILRLMREIEAMPVTADVMPIINPVGLGGCSPWAEEACNKAIHRGIVVGDGHVYRWQDNITREELCVILDRCGLLD